MSFKTNNPFLTMKGWMQRLCYKESISIKNAGYDCTDRDCLNCGLGLFCKMNKEDKDSLIRFINLCIETCKKSI